MRSLPIVGILICLMAAAGCSDDGNKGVCDPLAPDCDEGLVCEVLLDGKPHCFAPLTIRGRVLDATDDSPIEGAIVQAVDPNGSPVGSSDVTDSDGDYRLSVPTTRDKDGNPVSGVYSLRVQAAGYQPFPTAIRPALPLEATSAQGNADDGWLIDSALTIVKLLPLPGDVSGLGSISGTIEAELNAGVLVVAESADAGYAGYSDFSGDYTIFNVPAGSYNVSGYLAGVQLVPADTSLAAGENKTGVDLAESQDPLSTVSGNVQIVNAPGGLTTSVVLAVESTFVENAARGEVPPGLRVGEVLTAFTIENVPDGNYVVLAAFENDQLVRDPDQTIGGTQIVHIQVPDPDSGNEVSLAEGFKITEALEIFSPGAEGPELVDTATPTFDWADDSSEEGYEIRVFDAFGNEIWYDETLASVATHTYAGPALEEGMYYQFKVLSFREKTGTRTAISATEDLKGVFYYSSVP